MAMVDSYKAKEDEVVTLPTTFECASAITVAVNICAALRSKANVKKLSDNDK